MYILETDGLTHQFDRADLVINGLNLMVPQGSIYGFLGVNGAGKTTTLRLILGLLRRQSGQIYIDGRPFDKNRVSILNQVGSLIESPSIYGHLTVFENLMVFQKIYQCPLDRLYRVLEMVGLSEIKQKKAAQLSLGMKQRLGIAIAMLHNPALLILDEPTNGLDPNGIIEIRELLKKMNQENGVSILISSHLLPEIEKLVSHVGIIDKGRLVFEGTLQQLMYQRQQTSEVILETSDASKASEILSGTQKVEKLNDNKLMISVSDREQIGIINRQLVEAGVMVYEMRGNKKNLETIFIDLIDK